MAEHTKLPWKFSPNSFGTQFIYGDPKMPKQSPMGISYPHLIAGGDHPGTLTEANAAFIVKAVNNHVEMDQLLAEAADFLNCSPTIEGMDIGAKITAFRLRLQKGIRADVAGSGSGGK